MMEILYHLKGGSLSQTVVCQEGSRLFVRKSISRSINREYGLVRWHSQIRKLQLFNKYLPEHSIAIDNMGVTDDYFHYEIPFLKNSTNCFDALLNGLSESLLANEIASAINKMASINYSTIKGSFGVYIAEEILSPLKFATTITSSNQLMLNDEESSFFNSEIRRGLALAESLFKSFEMDTLSESLTHGNLTLENILWDFDTKKIIFIDPYAETYCETILGDVSQLFQSAVSGYEFASKFFESNNFFIDQYPIENLPACFKNFSTVLLDNISSEPWFSESSLRILQASQFTRMFPFKIVNNPRQGAAFILHAIKLLEKV
jgi:hypothetical protein